MSIKPAGYRITVKPDNVDEKMEHDLGNGKKFILMGDKRIEKTMEIRGTLVGAGPQAWKAFGKDFTGEPWAKVGDRILFAQHAGRFITDEETGEDYLIMNDEDVTAVITGES